MDEFTKSNYVHEYDIETKFLKKLNQTNSQIIFGLVHALSIV